MRVLLVWFGFLIQCCYYKQILSCLIFCFSNTAATLQIFSNRKYNSLLLLTVKTLIIFQNAYKLWYYVLKTYLKNSYFNYINLFFISMNLKANNRSRENPNKSRCLRILAFKATSNLMTLKFWHSIIHIYTHHYKHWKWRNKIWKF